MAKRGIILLAGLLLVAAACGNVDAEPGQRAGYLVNSKTRRWAKSAIKGTNLGGAIWDTTVPDSPVNGYRAAVRSRIPHVPIFRDVLRAGRGRREEKHTREQPHGAGC